MDEFKTIRYISDTHFYHENCIKYDNRPWKTIEEGNAKMVELWNQHVLPTDLVYVLGDFVWKKYDKWLEITRQLNGSLYFVKGNHDSVDYLNNLKRDFPDKVLGWSEQKTVKDGNRFVVLNHCPILCYPNNYHGWYHLYGHVHGTYDYNVTIHTQRCLEELYQRKFPMYNVGAMHIGYYPRTLDEIEALYAEKSPEDRLSDKISLQH